MNTSGRRLAPELSGVDLVRVAPHQAREAAKARDESGTCKEMRCTRAAISRGDGREPSGFAAVLQGLAADRAWDIPAMRRKHPGPAAGRRGRVLTEAGPGIGSNC